MTRSPLLIRDERPADVDGIRQVQRLAFPTDAEARLVEQLRADGHLAISLVAEREGQVVGHLALSPISIDAGPDGPCAPDDAKPGLALAPVAVVPDQQRKGIGSGLVRQALAVCRASRVHLVVVLGEPGFYSRFGFVPADTLGLRDTYGGGDAFQAIALATDQLKHPALAGMVRYAPAFAMFG